MNLFGLPCDEDEMRIRAVRLEANAPTKFDPAQSGHIPVRKNDVGPIGLMHVPRFETVTCDRAGVAK
jgi:hypothetical protein